MVDDSDKADTLRFYSWYTLNLECRSIVHSMNSIITKTTRVARALAYSLCSLSNLGNFGDLGGSGKLGGFGNFGGVAIL